MDRGEDMGTYAVTVGSQIDRMREGGGRIIKTFRHILVSVSVYIQSKKRTLQQREQSLPGILDDVSLHEKITELPRTSLEKSKKRRFSEFLSKRKRFKLVKSEQLLPGIPDDVTLSEITTKLPYIAIRNRQVYDTRVRCGSTDTLVLLDQARFSSVGLYHMIEKASISLPKIPFLVRGAPGHVRTVVLDGRMYFLGGDQRLELHKDRWKDVKGTDVFVLDLAGSMGWERCASMLEPRSRFDCGVVDGKICIFGGNYRGKPVGGSEVYDPDRDVWSSIQPMKNPREDHHVVAVGDELILKGGRFYVHGGPNMVHRDEGVEVYHTVRNEWRRIENFLAWDTLQRLFTVEGKLHVINLRGIFVRDTYGNSWIQRHSNSFSSLGPDLTFFLPHRIVVENDQLLMGLCWVSSTDLSVDFEALVRTRGFGTEIKELVREKVQTFLVAGVKMCSIEL